MSIATATQECDICGGPCREPFEFPQVLKPSPFLSPEVIAMSQPEAPTADQPAPTGKRMKSKRENREKPHDENREAPPCS